MNLGFPKKPFKTLGGAHVPHHKNTAAKESVRMPAPALVTIPMVQHIGAPCKALVKKGDYVYVGQKIGDSDAFVSAPIHASVSGTVKELKQVMLTAGQMVEAVVIESDGKMEADPAIAPPPPVETKEALAKIARDSGLVGLGGAGFPTHVKLNVPIDRHIDTLIINVAECEPFITADHREILENGKAVLDGVYKIKAILGVERVIIAIEDNKPDAIKVMTEIADNPELDPEDEVRVLALKSSYPQGAEKVIVQATTGRRVPPGKLPSDVGCLVMNIASIAFISDYIRTGMPLVTRRVTVDGSALKNPMNVIAPIGTSLKEIIEFTGGYKSEVKKIILGGPMMGTAVTTDELPLLKQNNGILCFDEKDAVMNEPTDCIRCGRCVAACPMNLLPSKLEKHALAGDVDTLKKLDIMTCMECGCCSFSCPAGRKIVQTIRLGKNLVRKAGAK